MSRDVGVGQLVDELQARGDRLPFEIGAFVALEACEGLLQESVKLEADDVRVTLDGAVLVSDSAERAEPGEAARSLASVLGRLLVAAGPGVPPNLLQLVKDSATGDHPQDLRRLHDAIEASLIPINRGASRRVLARLVRESDRPPAPETGPGIDADLLDAELDELLRDPAVRTFGAPKADPPSTHADVDEPITERIRMPKSVAKETELDLQPETLPVPPSEPARRRSSMSIPDLRPAPATPTGGTAPEREPASKPARDPVTATIRKWQPSEEPGAEAGTPESGLVLGAAAGSAPPRPEAASQPPSRPSQSPIERHDERPSATPAPPPTRRRGGWGIWLLAAALGLGAYALIASGAFDRSGSAPPSAEPGVIEVAVTPEDAQVFLFVGRGPATASGLQVGEAHEFLVLGRGLRPTRASVPEGSAWPGALYELAVQAQPDDGSAGPADLGQPRTGAAAEGSAGDGTVRIVTNPPGAKVYRFVGPGPTLRIPVDSVHEGQELLVHHPAHETEREVVGPSDWVQQAGSAASAELAVELRALPDSSAPEPVDD